MCSARAEGVLLSTALERLSFFTVDELSLECEKQPPIVQQVGYWAKVCLPRANVVMPAVGEAMSRESCWGWSVPGRLLGGG